MLNHHSPDDSPLTAYLLGELSSAEVTQLEEQLAASPALREELDGLRGTVAALQSAFAHHSETQPAVPAIDREKLHSLLRSAIATPAIGASAAAPMLLASRSADSRPARGRGLMVGGAIAVLVGLVAVSQFETRKGPSQSVVVSNGVESRHDLRLRDDLSTGLPQEFPEQQLMQMVTPRINVQEEELLGLPAAGTVVSRGATPMSSFSVRSLGKSLTEPRVTDDARDLNNNRFGHAGFGTVPTPARSAPASSASWEYRSAHPDLVAEQSAELGVAEMDGTNLGYRQHISDAAPGRQLSYGMELSRSPDVYALPEIRLRRSDWGFYRLADGEKNPDSFSAETTGSNKRVDLFDRIAVDQPVRLSKATGFALHTAEVAQLRAAVENLEQLVASSGNGRVDSLGREKRFDDLSELFGWQRVLLTQLDAKLAEPIAAEVRAAQASDPASETMPDATDLSLLAIKSELVSEQTLALAEAREEVNRAYTAWYYREGRIRQAREYIAAAESYAHVPENDFVTPDAQPLSTFGIDVDTASYANVRRFVESNQLPPPDAVRIEELVNSFKYDGPTVAAGEAPLALAAEVGICPWQPQHQLLRVALKGKSIDLEARPAARLVFLVDTSGSMSDENKLPLVKQSLRLLVEQMREQDRLSIVTYNDNAGLLLDSTGGDKREVILAKIDALVSDGSTNGEAGLKLAYAVAVKQFAEGATNRVMLCTDGDFNVGESSDSAMVKLIEKERQTGVFLNIFGFGSGNLKDSKLEAIADKGNGQYIYIDGIKEARKTLLNELTGTLYTIAKDVKLQIEFNPALVGSYRLVGYENRMMAAQDFANDKVDSGDLGAGHSVVALYEIIPPGAVAAAPKPAAEPLKYQRAGSVRARSEAPAPAKTSEVSEDLGSLPPAADPLATELCTIRVRYKQPTSNESTKIETVVSLPTEPMPLTKDFLWATAVAEFGLVLRHSSFVGSGNFSQVLELAQSAIGDDPTGQRREFLTLVRQTQHLEHQRGAQIAELSKMVREDEQLIQRRDEAAKNAELMAKASCSGKYKTLLRQLEVPSDQASYGDLKDFGRWEGTEYQSYKNLPPGYWVYAAPHWYIWNETTEQVAVMPAK